MRALVLVVSAGIVCQALAGEPDNITNVRGGQISEEQAIHQLMAWIKSNRYYDFPLDCLRAKSLGYKNAGYTIELAAEGCPGNTPEGLVGRWRVDAKTAEIYVQNEAGKYVSPQLGNKGISQSLIREEHSVMVDSVGTFAEDSVVTLRGTLLVKDFFDGEKTKKRPVYILRLATPVAVEPANPDDDASTREIHLIIIQDVEEERAEKLVNKQVTVIGELSQRHTIHHARSLIMVVQSIR